MASLPTTYPGKILLIENITHSVSPNSIGPVRIAVIGGTGLSDLPHFTKVASLNVETPWGSPASPITILEHPSSTSKPLPVAFLARHGIHHQLAPHEVPSRANIAALRSIGVRTIIAFSAVGSLQEAIKPRDFVIPDQIIDRTKGIRPFTFFEGGFVGHVPFGDPFDEGIAKVVRTCGKSLEGDGVVLHEQGTVICMGNVSWFRLTVHTLTDAQKGHNSAPVPSR
jgi:purine nucleoside phosphorylase